jgi:hypothetical protein
MIGLQQTEGLVRRCRICPLFRPDEEGIREAIGPASGCESWPVDLHVRPDGQPSDMPRRQRIESEGAIDHVMARCDARQMIVRDDAGGRRPIDGLEVH